MKNKDLATNGHQSSQIRKAIKKKEKIKELVTNDTNKHEERKILLCTGSIIFQISDD